MNVVVDRFIELSVVEQYRRLTKNERYEKNECLKYLTERQWKLAKLKNLSLMASMIDNTEWQHEICAEIDRLQDRR